MPAGRQLAALLLGIVLAGCTLGLTKSPSPTVSIEPLPTEPPGTVLPSPTPDPCAVAVARVGTFVVRVGESVATLRPLIRSKSFDAVATLGVMRHLSSLLDADSDILAVVSACPSMTSLAGQIGPFTTNAGKAVAAAIAAGFGAAGQRNAAVQMFRLLRPVVRISTANAAIADGLGLHPDVLVLAPGTTAPLGTLPPLPK